MIQGNADGKDLTAGGAVIRGFKFGRVECTTTPGTYRSLRCCYV